MNEKPTTEEARQDLANIRQELEAMRNIQTNAEFLAARDDVDSTFYKSIVFKQNGYILRGEILVQKILTLYPELTSM